MAAHEHNFIIDDKCLSVTWATDGPVSEVPVVCTARWCQHRTTMKPGALPAKIQQFARDIGLIA